MVTFFLIYELQEFMRKISLENEIEFSNIFQRDLIGAFFKCKQTNWLLIGWFLYLFEKSSQFLPFVREFELAEIENGAFKIETFTEAILLQQ